MATQYWNRRLAVEPEGAEVASAGAGEQPCAGPARAEVPRGQPIGIPVRFARRNADLLHNVAETLGRGGPKAERLRALLRRLETLPVDEVIAEWHLPIGSRRRH
ncbi:hypothetical protein [Geminicoccus harenae]|uniref:hypothetical protein n=1 Tax=Geminicoccus harenae TaxID=2498453 RepID=UPI00168ABF5E|nr:hypothetical protein [Geminicoccus harenae]